MSFLSDLDDRVKAFEAKIPEYEKEIAALKQDVETIKQELLGPAKPPTP